MRCWFFHRWNKWSGPVLIYELNDGKKTGENHLQKRTCRRCGMVEERLTR